MSALLNPNALNGPSNVVSLCIIPPDEDRVWDVLRRAQQTGAHLVTNGFEIYVTPAIMPGEFPVAMREAA
jgi:hypothetical protein